MDFQNVNSMRQGPDFSICDLNQITYYQKTQLRSFLQEGSTNKGTLYTLLLSYDGVCSVTVEAQTEIFFQTELITRLFLRISYICSMNL